MNKFRNYRKSGTLSWLAFLLATSLLAHHVARAVPYASGVISNNNQVTFVLNQEAQGLVVLRDGANPVYPGTTPGRLSFDMTGFTRYSIIVTGNTPKAWTKFIADGTDRSFYVPRGLAVNKNPRSPNFGKVYVSESRGGRTASTTYGRTTSDGIYVLHADGVADGGVKTGGIDWTIDGTAGSAPLRSVIGPDDHLYVVSLFSDLAYEFNDDMSVATPLIDASNRTTGQWVHSIWVEGTKVAGNRKIYLVNGNYLDGRRGLIGYELGASEAVTPNDTGTQMVGPEAFNYYPYDVVRDSSGFWYLNQYRASAGQAVALQKFDGSVIPNNTPVWSVPNTYFYTESLDINEAAGVIAVGRYDNGIIYFFEMATGQLRESFDCGNRAREQAFDAAGNLVTVDNGAEWVRFWSPGGFTIATTTSDGTFDVFTPDNLSVTSPDLAAAEEGTDTATVVISRSGGSNRDQLVYFALTGTAGSNVDYTISATSPLLFKAGETSTNITITPIDDVDREPAETVILTLVPTPDYYILSQSSVTAKIADNDATMRYWDANGAEPGGGLNPNGVWGSDTFWSTSADGLAATSGWQDWALGVFSAGTDWGTFTVTINGTQKVDGPIIEDSIVTFSGGTLLLTNYSAIAVATSAQATINSAVGGVSGLTKDGPGTLVLGGANTYSGATTINDGILQTQEAERIPDSSAVSIGSTGTLELGSFNETIGSLAGVDGATANVAGGTLTFGGDNTDTTWNGTASAGGLLVKVGSGTTGMNAGTVGDALAISNGVFSINAAARLGSANSVTIDNGATLQSVSEGVGSDFISPGRTITIGTGGGTVKVANSGAILMVRDTSAISGPGELTKDGPGELRTYSVEHSFSKLVVKAGMFTAGHSTSFGYNTSFGAVPATLTPDAITIQNAAAIRKAGGQNVTLDPKQGITLGTGGGIIRAYAGDTNTGTFEIPGPISGPGSLTLGNTADVGAFFILGGANTYSGGTTIVAGTNHVRTDGGLGTGNVTVNSGAALTLSGGTANAYINSAATLTLNGASPRVDLDFTGAPNLISALYIGGSQMAAGTWGAVGSGAAHESALFTGTGMLNVSGGQVEPVADMTIKPATGGGFSITYSGGSGSRFVLLQSLDVAAPLNLWTRVATNTASSGTFTIQVGTDPTGFYRIQSE